MGSYNYNFNFYDDGQNKDTDGAVRDVFVAGDDTSNGILAKFEDKQRLEA